MNIFVWFKNRSIKIKLAITALSLGVIIFILMSLLGTYAQNQFLRQDVKESITENKNQMDNLLKHDAQLLSTSLDFFIKDENIKKAFIAGNRETLYALSLPYFTTLQKDSSFQTITFAKPDATIFLRMQRKDVYGDKNDLHILEDVKKSQTERVGVEISKRQIALWAVAPYKNNGDTIGYILFGENINKLADILTQETENTYAIFVDKQYLDKGVIDTATDENAKILQTNWNTISDHVLVNKVSIDPYLSNACFNHKNIKIADSNKPLQQDINYKNNVYTCVGLPLYDYQNKIIGVILYVENLTDRFISLAQIGYIMTIALGIAAILVMLLMISFINQWIFLPMNKAKNVMEKIKGGDLQSRVPVDSADEFGQMAILFNSMTAKLEELNSMKDEFLSVAAHQLRTPLGSMRWNMEMIMNGDYGKLTEKIKNAIEENYKSCLRMIMLVNDLLNVSRIDQHRMILHPEPVDVQEHINHLIQELQNLIQKKAIDIKVISESKHLPKIIVDPVHFHEVCQNLLSNAIKYNKYNGKIVITLKTTESHFHISVHDTGIGIPQNEQRKIFYKFFRASNAVLTETEGTGLGLFVVKSYIEQCGGKIWFTSKQNEGTTFYLCIPLEVNKSKEKCNGKEHQNG